MLRSPLIGTGLALLACLVGSVGLAAAQTASSSTGPSVEIESLERIVSKKAARVLEVGDAIRFRVNLAFKTPSGFTVENSTVTLEGILPDGTKKAMRVTASGSEPFVELSLQRPPTGVLFQSFNVKIASKVGSGVKDGAADVAEDFRAFSAEQVTERVAEQ